MPEKKLFAPAQGQCFLAFGASESLMESKAPFPKTPGKDGLSHQGSLVKYLVTTILQLMRKRFEVQLALGRTPIERVVLPVRSRDELPPVLAGLQWIFQTPELNSQIFELLERKVEHGHVHAREDLE